MEKTSPLIEVLQMRFSASLNESIAMQVEIVELRRALEAMTAERDALKVKAGDGEPTPMRKSA